jgi:glycosyltransferase involved in cell wall biosynthesis
VDVWHILTPEFPPQVGGVADYTYLVASGLAEAGDEVHVWCPPSGYAPPSSDGLTVHDECGTLSPADFRRVGRWLDRFTTPRRLLVQWVPHGYGYRSMNLPFCLWLWRRAVVHGDEVDIMVHEPYLAFWEGPWRQAAAALVHRLMTVVLLRAARRVWIAIPGWEERWRPYALGRSVPFVWLPVPSGLRSGGTSDANAIRAQFSGRDRPLIGHFGTYGPPVADLLADLVPYVLAGRSVPSLLLLGAQSDSFRQRMVRAHPDLAARVHAVGHLSSADVTAHLAACDLLIQPYPDGISSRRTSAMTGLSLGLPIVTTSGHLTEPLWSESGAVLLADVADPAGFAARVEGLLEDVAARKRLGESARVLYDERFDIKHTIAALRAPLVT